MTQKTGPNDFFSAEEELISVMETAQTPVEKEPSVLTPVEQEIYDNLTPKEKEGLKAAMDQMDFNDPNMRNQYGLKTREGIAEISSKSLEVARTRDLGAAGQSMTTLIKQLRNVDIKVKQRGIFGKVRSAIEEFNAQLTSVERNIDKAVAIMKGHQAQLATDIQTYDQLYLQNLGYYKALTKYIIAGKLKLDEERKTILAALKKKAEETGDMAAIEAYDDYRDKLDKFERLLDEFESTRLQCIQTAPTLRMAKSNNEALIEKFDFIFLSAVPSWKLQLQLMLAQENAKQAGEAIDAAIDFHQDIIRKNAELLGRNNVEVARITEREILDVETLEYANQQLLKSMNEVLEIHEAGKAKRYQSRQDKARMEEEMKNELLKFARR